MKVGTSCGGGVVLAAAVVIVAAAVVVVVVVLEVVVVVVVLAAVVVGARTAFIARSANIGMYLWRRGESDATVPRVRWMHTQCAMSKMDAHTVRNE